MRFHNAARLIGAALAAAALHAASQLEVSAAKASIDRTEQVAPGITHRTRQYKLNGEPFSVHIVEADPKLAAINLLPVRAEDRAIGKETTSSMAKRFGAAAAINGGYFEVPGVYAGTSHGAYLWNGEALSSGANRSAVLLCRETKFREHIEIDVVNFEGAVTAPDGSTLKAGVLNRPRKPGELAIYTPMLGATTRTPAEGFEAAVDRSGRVLSTGKGDTAIPKNGYVLSATGEAAAWLEKRATTGAQLKVEWRLATANPAKNGCQAEDIVGAGPRLIERGMINVTDEHFGHATVRHPRSALAVTRQGALLFYTVDGRQPSSVGMTLRELAEELAALGALEAINLDGGGSTTMVVNGVVRNSPSDKTERPVSDALLLFSIPNAAALGSLIERLSPGQIQADFAATLRKTAAGPGGLKAVEAAVRGAAPGKVSPTAARLILEACGSLAQ